MDAEMVDQDVLNLKFVCEVESFGQALKPPIIYILIKMTKEEKYLEPNLLDIQLDEKHEETMLMSHLDHSPVTDQCGNDRDNDYERVDLKDVVKEYSCFNIIFNGMIIDSKVLPLFWTKYYDVYRTTN
ncbi:hypothetical protein H5410_003691 [Solanum commersonii]|uniref:Uncharacterized protein n=1 Tax=Solanum commersonii TaxID=4109 RepID=A0A9J6B5G1_SOLCO|nr:hypothetical protein H5410_003691 [Solanum commersonii]